MNIELTLDVMNHNGGPDIRLLYNGKCYYEGKLKNKGVNEINVNVPDFNLPGALVLEHYGKDIKRDTLIDSKGNILNDKGFSIMKIKIGTCELINEIFLFNLTTEDNVVIKKTNYVGFNGKYVVDIDHKNLQVWHNSLQKFLFQAFEQYDYIKFKDEILQGESCEVDY